MNYCLECNTELTSKYAIKFCCSSCSAIHSNKSRTASGWTMSKAIRDKISASLTGRTGHPNTHKGKQLIARENRLCKECGNAFWATPSDKKLYCSTECSSKHIGGYREGSGKSKSGYYKGIYCGSTYELCWVIYRLDHQLPVKRFDGYILYDNNRKYYPDFIDGTHIFEMKGWLCKKTDPEVQAKSLAAINQGYTIDVLFKEDLEKEFNWVKEKYNTSKFHILYDNYKPTFIYNCNHCGCEVAKDKKAKTDKVFCSRVCAGKGHTGRNNKPHSSND